MLKPPEPHTGHAPGVSDTASVYSHIPRQYGSLGHAQFEDEGGKAFSLILSFSS